MLPPERSQLLNAGAGIGFDFWIVYQVVIILSYNGATWGLANRFMAEATPRQRELVGFPPPGDPLWTPFIEGMAARYPGFDPEPYHQAKG
jgi:hypothetical protein